jgi:hypothetical protein
MQSLPDAKNAEDLAKFVEQLAQNINRMRAAGTLCLSDILEAANILTWAQLLLNELERVELESRKVSKEWVERFIGLEGRIRELQDLICLELKYGKPSASQDGDRPI